VVHERDVEYLIADGSREHGRDEWVVDRGALNERDEHRCLCEVKTTGRDGVVAPRRCLDAVGLRAEVDGVEVTGEYLVLRELARELAGVNDLVDLSLDGVGGR
jgi:hypothetical protein